MESLPFGISSLQGSRDAPDRSVSRMRSASIQSTSVLWAKRMVSPYPFLAFVSSDFTRQHLLTSMNRLSRTSHKPIGCEYGKPPIRHVSSDLVPCTLTSKSREHTRVESDAAESVNHEERHVETDGRFHQRHCCTDRIYHSCSSVAALTDRQSSAERTTKAT